MKRIISVMSVMAIICCLCAGCGNEASVKSNTVSNSKTVNDVLSSQTSSAATAPQTVQTEKPKDLKTKPVSQAADINLPIMSSTAIYSEVLNMTQSPADYIGKRVIMQGTASYFKDEATGKTYYACLIADATACCSQGIEFTLDGDYTEDDYPVLGQEIKVYGVFDTYIEGEQSYCVLRDAYYVK